MTGERSGVGGLDVGCRLRWAGKFRAPLAHVPADELSDHRGAVAVAHDRAEGSPQVVIDPDGAVSRVGVFHEVNGRRCIYRGNHADVAVYIHKRYRRVYPRREQVSWQIGVCPSKTGGLSGMPEIDDESFAGSELEPYEATLFHVGLIAGKVEKLVAAQVEAERQVLHRVGRDFAAGRLSIEGLLEFYQRYRDLVWPAREDGKRRYVERPGFSNLWNEAIEPHSSQVANTAKAAWFLKRHEPNEGQGWSGEWPLRADDPRPRTGQCVVYVLFDDSNSPCYVGSTSGLKGRLQAHQRDKSFRRWVAHPCANREAAYELEVRLLQEHKPYLNKRVGR